MIDLHPCVDDGDVDRGTGIGGGGAWPRRGGATGGHAPLARVVRVGRRGDRVRGNRRTCGSRRRGVAVLANRRRTFDPLKVATLLQGREDGIDLVGRHVDGAHIDVGEVRRHLA